MITHPGHDRRIHPGQYRGPVPLPRPGHLGGPGSADRRRPHRRNVQPLHARAASGRHDSADSVLGDARAGPAGPGAHSGTTLDRNVSVTEPTPGIVSIAFQGDDADEAIPNLIAANDLTGGSAPEHPDSDGHRGRNSDRQPHSDRVGSQLDRGDRRKQRTDPRDPRRQSDRRLDRARHRGVAEHHPRPGRSRASASASRSPIPATWAT